MLIFEQLLSGLSFATRRLSLAFVSLSLLLSLNSCLYSQVTRPLDEDVQRTTLGDKVGRASIHSAAFLFAWGDAGVHAAAEDGEMTVVNHLDAEYTIILFGLYTRATTIAYGE